MKINNRNIRLNLGLNAQKKSSSQNNSPEKNKSVLTYGNAKTQRQNKINQIGNNSRNSNYPMNKKSFNNLSNSAEYSPYNTNEDEKVRREARALIAKTKNMMKELSLEKMKKPKTPLPNSINTRNLSKEKLNEIGLVNLNEFKTEEGKDTLPQQLFSKNKQIKLLEKEVKDKTQQLKIAQDKLKDKNDEIIKLNEALTLERSNNLKAENIRLQRKIYAAEKANEENKKTYEHIIEDLKTKYALLQNSNKTYETKIISLEKNNKALSRDKDTLNKKLNETNTKLTQTKEKLEIEKKVNQSKEGNIENLKIKLTNLCAIIKSLYEKENNFYVQRENFIQKFNDIFDTPFHRGSGCSSPRSTGSPRNIRRSPSPRRSPLNNNSREQSPTIRTSPRAHSQRRNNSGLMGSTNSSDNNCNNGFNTNSNNCNMNIQTNKPTFEMLNYDYNTINASI